MKVQCQPEVGNKEKSLTTTDVGGSDATVTCVFCRDLNTLFVIVLGFSFQ